MIGPSAHSDTFSRDNLPKETLQPEFLLDKFNYPKKDVLASLNKRVHIADSVKEMNFLIKKILNSKISKNVNQDFYNLFYKNKIIQRNKNKINYV